MNDLVERFGESLIQHGKHNDRIYLMKLSPKDYPAIISRIEALAAKNQYSKVFAKVPEVLADAFIRSGYLPEAVVPGFYRGHIRGLFLGKFYETSRSVLPRHELDEFKMLLQATPIQNDTPETNGLLVERLKADDTEEMAELYRTVFQSYPFPIDRADYLRDTMEDQTVYFGIRDIRGDRLIALSSAEVDRDDLNVEMTDFAVRPEHRGQKLAFILLQKMEEAMRQQGIITGYTIARLKSPGMNVTFLKSGYRYAGTLVNNTHIAGGFESMNVFYKTLTAWDSGPIP